MAGAMASLVTFAFFFYHSQSYYFAKAVIWEFLTLVDSSEGSMSRQIGNTSNGPQVFVSYRRVDNDPPPQSYRRVDGDPPPQSPERGFVDYLLTDVRYDLTQLGAPKSIFWQDRAKIAPADDWNEKIETALNDASFFIAVLSLNYVTSKWCRKELKTMRSRFELLGSPALQGRIFRIDKHKVPENKIPKVLRKIQSVRFYREDRYSERVDEFFWRGKVRFIPEYEGAVEELARGISSRLAELELLEKSRIPFQMEPPAHNSRRSNGHAVSARRKNGRVVFVAKPAGDMIPPYRALVAELLHAGFRVTPDPDADLGDLGKQVRSAVVKALREAEVAIHMIGASDGGRPKGLETAIVPMQLAAAADEAKRRARFERIIWAPSVLLSDTSRKPRMICRDPFQALGQFGQKLLEMDQIEGDTASHFNDFVLHRLRRKQGRKEQL
jgi:hypothetical protein